jgi:hypothetical protein
LKAADLKKLQTRDQNQCWHCGSEETITVQHRANRGMGGSKFRDQPSNLILLCWFVNFEMEASSVKAKIAKEYGWKLLSTDNSSAIPVYHYPSATWRLLDDKWGFTTIEGK